MEQRADDEPLVLSREQFRAWMLTQPRGRYERVNGEVVRMSAERVGHLRVKARVWQALDRAIRQAGVSCEALPDGATVEISDGTDYEPDAIVNCGPRMKDTDITASNPVIVVEVLSPSTRALDTGLKLTDYFRVPSILHYLIVRPDQRAAILHQRRDDGGIETRLIAGGAIRFDPPGLDVVLEELLRGVAPAIPGELGPGLV